MASTREALVSLDLCEESVTGCAMPITVFMTRISAYQPGISTICPTNGQIPNGFGLFFFSAARLGRVWNVLIRLDVLLSHNLMGSRLCVDLLLPLPYTTESALS